MKDIYSFGSYKDYVVHWVAQQPKRGYGQYKKISEHLGVGSVIVSQIFKGERHLSEEHGIELAEYLNLLEVERDYFLLLLRFERASSYKLKQHIQSQMDALKKSAHRISETIKPEFQLSEEKRATFFSQWQYSAIRLATDIPKYRKLEALSQFLDIEISELKEFVDFLIENGLCVLQDGEIRMGPKIVYLEPTSPYVLARHRSWRVKGFVEMERRKQRDLFFTSPIVCSEKTAEKITREISKLLEKVLADVKPSSSETLACLNVDWFRLQR